MDQKSEEKRVDPLPPNDDKFWDKADVKTHTLGNDTLCKKGEHSFKQVTGSEVRCKKCPLGFYLTPGSEVREGHIYLKGVLLI